MNGIVKLCGINRPQDVDAANVAAPDFIGMVIDYPRSPRSITVETAGGLASRSEIPVVAVLVDSTDDLISAVMRSVIPFAIQLSGLESPDRVRDLRHAFPDIELWKVIHISGTVDGSGDVQGPLEVARRYVESGVDRIMLDAAGGLMPGGTGTQVSWDVAARITAWSSVPVILAGGLNVSNVGQAIDAVLPDGVDVSSGTESAPGIKDPMLMNSFVSAARAGFAVITQTD